MSPSDINNIQMNINNYLMFSDFIYTSTRKSEFSLVETWDNQYQTVFIEIDAENRDGTPPFGCIEQTTSVNDDITNSKVLFACGSIFKIVSLSKYTNTSWSLKLSLTGNKELNLLAVKKQKLRQNKDLLMIAELLDQSNQSEKANIYCQHLLQELPLDHILIPKIREQINTDTIPQTVGSQNVQFVLIDLSTRLTPLASVMLNALRCLTNNSILMFNNSSDIDFDRIYNKTIIIFASSQAISSMIKKPSQLTPPFILDDDGNTSNEIGRFTNSEDFIFQLGDELYRWYKWESANHFRAGDITLANDKNRLANQIDSELKKVLQAFSENDSSNEISICTETIIVNLISSYDQENRMTKIETLFGDIVASFSTFDDADECFHHLCTTYYNNAVWLVIDNSYEDKSVAGFRPLINVKKIYRYNQLSSTQDATNDNPDNLFERLILDLISHYNQLATECKDKNDKNNEKDMILKARKLCELLNTIPNI